MSASMVGLVAGSLCALSFLPQVLKIWKEKSAKDISLPTFIVFSFGVFLWLIYGFMIGDWPIILANFLMFILASTVLIFKLKFG